MKMSKLLAALALIGGLVVSSVTSASTSFSLFTNNGYEDLSSQLVMETSAGSGNEVFFKFSNNVGIASSITDVYFDLGPASSFALGNMSIGDQSGTDFSMGANPGNVPGWSTIGFSADSGLTADSNSPHLMENGINALGEYLTISAFLTSGTYDALLSDLRSGMFRVAMHVQAIGDRGGSDSYVTTTVPLPAAAWLFGSALLGFMGFSVRRKA
jgi:hypothetical protein